MPEMPGFRGTITTVLHPDEFVTRVEVCPQPGNKRVEVSAPDAQMGGGNTWQPQYFSAVDYAMRSGVGSSHGNICRNLRDLTSTITAVDDTSWE